ncbi:hypothetical protein SLE2022_028820 [Rubroshorea leprosula]
MKTDPKEQENSWIWHQGMKNPSIFPWNFYRVIACSIALFSTLYFVYCVSFLNSSNRNAAINITRSSVKLDYISPQVSDPALSQSLQKAPEKTSLHHIVFGIAASSRFWNRRKEYIKLWWRPKQMRGAVWLDKPVANGTDDHLLPPTKISGDISRFKYENRRGHRSAIRISRIVSETSRLGLEDVRWFVMGDDDTYFVPENIVSVLSKYDHTQFYYIGSSSETHAQNINFSYGMAFGGGGFAISYPLAKALEKMQDRCIERYPALYGSDDRIQACMSELGVPLTKEPGFHQFDVFGNVFGLLAAHPIAPLVSLHHLDVVEPIFPDMDRVKALKQLTKPIKLDSAGLMQQSVCYDKTRSWTVSVSWGYAVQIIRGIISVRELEVPARTFFHWYKRADKYGYSFNTRFLSNHVCEKPFIYYLSNASFDRTTANQTVSKYVRSHLQKPDCKWNMADPSRINIVEVYKRPDPHVWEKPPRRNCCKVLPKKKQDTMEVDVRPCREDEVIELW